MMKFTFRYTKRFNKCADSLFTIEELIKLEIELMSKPNAGDVIPGGKGLRKMRFSAKGKGKRGGSRVIYLRRNEEGSIVMVAVYSKNKKEDISADELKQLIQEANE